MKEALDFLEDSRQLLNLLEDKTERDFQVKTQFKNWTINDIIGHLHIFNFAANLSLKSSDEFKMFFAPFNDAIKNRIPLLDNQKTWLKGLSGHALLDAWWKEVQIASKNFKTVDPKLRLKWVGPDMSARSSITARQMETWAHAQEIFDIFGETRVENDRIKNIVHLGVLTFPWTFINRKLKAPADSPYVQLYSPSGNIWEWNDPSSQSQVKGSAVEFASVVTQTRNFLDTCLEIKGDEAVKWMSFAQCFAGPPEDPPKPNTRYPINKS
tara:strand:+ start:307 stop:1110 length:804 start_codon:yes stop_codon:yes gene_type:complete